jgi:DNA damage-binding protein 1
MAYVAPIHRASSVRHAVKLRFFESEEDCLILAYGDSPRLFSLLAINEGAFHSCATLE